MLKIISMSLSGASSIVATVVLSLLVGFAATVAHAEERLVLTDETIGAFPGWAYPALEIAINDLRQHAPEINIDNCIVVIKQYNELNFSIAFYDSSTLFSPVQIMDSELYYVTLSVDGFRVHS